MLMDQGVVRGPILGQLLHEAEDIAINSDSNDGQLVINSLILKGRI